VKLGLIKSARSCTFIFTRETRKYKTVLLLWPNFSPFCIKDNTHNTTKQEMEMEIVECNIDDTRKLRKIMEHFIHFRTKKYKQEGTCIRPKMYTK
jgi:hypothetical protein